MKAAIVIPAYNEERTIGKIIKECKKFGTVIVVNDASSDNTEKIAKQSRSIVLNHKKNQGLGSALRTGFAKAKTMRVDMVITIDADSQHLPGEIRKFMKEIEKGYDFVLGARDLSKYPFVKKFGNFFLNAATNMLSGTHLKDTESGFRAIRLEALKKMKLNAKRYEIAAEIIKEVGRNNLRATNIPIESPIYRKGVSVSDGVKNFLYILRR